MPWRANESDGHHFTTGCSRTPCYTPPIMVGGRAKAWRKLRHSVGAVRSCVGRRRHAGSPPRRNKRLDSHRGLLE